MLPISHNLKEIFTPTRDQNSEFKVQGDIKCTCGEEGFEIKYVADNIHGEIEVTEVEGKFFLIIKSLCTNCQSVYELFDKDFHGWNGFVCEGFGNRVYPRPKPQTWHCNSCNHLKHKIWITIFSKGKEDFIQENDGDFDENDWVEAFSWIKIGIECSNCGQRDDDWIFYEAM